MSSTFAQRAGVHTLSRQTACHALLQRLEQEDIHSVRVAWCDLHGVFRGKTLMPRAVASALSDGVGMVSTLMLKDTSDRTAFKVFEPGSLAALAGFGMANNVLLLPDPASLRLLPWAPGTAWLQAQPWFEDGTPVPLDPRRVLQQACARLAQRGLQLRVGLEVEFHIYRIDTARERELAHPDLAAWPGEPPPVSLLHPGFNLLAEGWADQADGALQIVRQTAQALGLPLRSLEIELGPSQVEAVFDATDALTAADQMALFRNGVKQALRRAGFHATFMCRPPFAQIMASGWHLHQSLQATADGRNAFMRGQPAPGSTAVDAGHWLSDVGQAWLAGLLQHAPGAVAFASSTANAYGRFRPHAMAPQAVIWARDNRGAALRVLGGPGDAATRIENRVGEPMANPYLYIASQIVCGMDGLARDLRPPTASLAPYADGQPLLPSSLGAALDALAADPVVSHGMGTELVACLNQIKRSEQSRLDAATDAVEWQRREYFSRF